MHDKQSLFTLNSFFKKCDLNPVTKETELL